MQPVRDDAEADGEQPDDDAQPEPRRPRHARLGERPRQRQGDDHEHAEHGGVGARQREVEQVGGDEREPGEQQRALEARDPLAPAAAAARRGGGEAGLGGGGSSVIEVMDPHWRRAATRRDRAARRAQGVLA